MPCKKVKTKKQSSKKANPIIQPCKKAYRNSYEPRVPDIPFISETIDSPTFRNYGSLRQLFEELHVNRNPSLIKSVVTMFKKKGISKERIVEIAWQTGCSLDAMLLLNDADITRISLKRRTKIQMNESYLLLEVAMKSSYLQNVQVLLQYGPGAPQRCEIFYRHMIYLVNRPKAHLKTASRYIHRLMAADVIDVYSLKFLEVSFEHGQTRAIKMLFGCNVDKYVKRKLRDNLLVHLFANKKVNAVKLARRRLLDINSQCGGMTALHLATFRALDTNVRILLDAGADPNIRDFNGLTPLFCFGNRSCIELLLQNGADVQSIANKGYTIFDMMFPKDLLDLMVANVALIESQGTDIKKVIRDKIVANSWFNDLYEECCEQIERIKHHDDFILLTALNGQFKCLERFVYGQDIVDELIKECLNLQIDSYYLATIQVSLNKALFISNLRSRSVTEVLPALERYQLDEFIVARIMDYLTFEELPLYVRVL